ncbi:MAG: hypothetical protein Dbin4_02570 [Alphaproteobacteria bacterium]|nr:hypothetical protein [Alphaproteobacteria bacterium]
MNSQGAVTRRRFVQTTAAGSLVLASPGFVRKAGSQTAKPNILFIMADDLGYADVGCYGQRYYKTPHIDSLADGGLKFMQAYANSAVCSPTRLALITGRYQYHLPIGLEEPLFFMSPKNTGLPPDHPTLPSQLKKVGYGTTLVGKWHLGEGPDFGPLKSGYDQFYGVLGGSADYFNHGADTARQAPLSAQLHDQETPIEQPGYLTDLLGDRAAQTIEGYAKSKQLFLLSLHFTAPHWPWEGPGDEAESRRIKNLHHTDGGSQETFKAMVQSMDANIGKVLHALESNGLARNTIVIFTSDNGGERFSDNGPFIGSKSELLEGGLRVPAIVRWPAHIAPGSVTQQVNITMDWMPTLLAAAGGQADPAYPMEGESLMQVLTGNPAPHPRKLFWRYKSHAQSAVRDGDWKYLRINGNEFLFDVVRDPRERANLKDRHKDIFDRLRKDWEVWNATLLPETAAPSYRMPGNLFADHYGVVNPPAPPPAK